MYTSFEQRKDAMDKDKYDIEQLQGGFSEHRDDEFPLCPDCEKSLELLTDKENDEVGYDMVKREIKEKHNIEIDVEELKKINESHKKAFELILKSL